LYQSELSFFPAEFKPMRFVIYSFVILFQLLIVRAQSADKPTVTVSGTAQEVNGIGIHPNSIEASVSIDGVDWKVTTLRIFDGHGYRYPVRIKDSILDVADFPNGMYYFTFSGPEQPVVVKVILNTLVPAHKNK
jgi:hypothetical protein